ncbi:MAG: hypothetical protein MJ221_04490 [Bacilli bacterium]|nr:hypothetical protein [Bacilli bacterium]
MSTKAKKILFFSGLSLDVAIMVFLLTVSIVMLATMPDTILAQHPEWVIEKNGPFIGFLQTNPTLYLCTCVIPLIVLLVVNIIGLVVYVKKAGKKKAMLADLSEEQKAALREELLKEMQDDKKE